MRASLRRLHSPEINDLAAYCPQPPDNFGFLLQAFVGPEHGAGEESFDFVVCTPKWLQQKHATTDIVRGRHHLIVFEYDYQRVMQEIQRLCESAIGATWRDVAVQLSRFGKWEFEDYTE
jgi:hypothetical protein